jgi:hypothetical protein
MVHRAAATTDSENAAANNYYANANPGDYAAQLAAFHAANSNSYMQRVDGACPLNNPTTPEVIQWAAYKWGLDPRFMYAEATQEGGWNQNAVGDNGGSHGIFQVADRNSWTDHADPSLVNSNLAQESSCFNADDFAAHIVMAFQGHYGRVPAGDLMAAINSWFTGAYAAPGPYSYAQSVCGILQSQGWSRFVGG